MCSKLLINEQLGQSDWCLLEKKFLLPRHEADVYKTSRSNNGEKWIHWIAWQGEMDSREPELMVTSQRIVINVDENLNCLRDGWSNFVSFPLSLTRKVSPDRHDLQLLPPPATRSVHWSHSALFHFNRHSEAAEDGEKLMIFGIGRLIDPSTAYLGCERWLCVCIQYFSPFRFRSIESWIEAIS